ncbi:DUF2889 domain-containing protein [Roseateles puraquae]|jgi:hypothetical protein|uniref:DUF2889 domain-containing protein n=1 Tax=Roseateles puraquae TaxID=431059 RepID=A0A254N6K2_9BURK|nr:DUF2889 domain-containing protein [Roseateles puraquae]MDG0857168.1 DUF2889 domain-containing protein [Roseateles puraquae]OWR03194.1 hypothetical protein CDO81_16680 [Roseateles puraquae]
MPADHPSIPRRLLHRRALDVQVFARDDGLFDVEASLTDTKTHDVPLAGEPRKAGDPIHEMRLLLTVDASLTITAATSQTLWMPYVGACDQHGDAYAQLVGLNLLKGFRQAVQERLRGTRGCTHLTELCLVLPTAVLQAMAGSIIDTREGDADGNPPFQLDRCHALRRDGETVATFYPRWHQKKPARATTVS